MDMISGRRLPLVMFLLLLAGCGITGSAARPDDESGFDVITQAELSHLSSRSALQAVRQLRPRWLRGRGPAIGVGAEGGRARVIRGEERVQVYVDGVRQDLDAIDLMRASDVEVMSFLSASEATLRFGTDHPAGAILVTTRTH